MFKFYRLSRHFKMRCPSCFHELEQGEDRKFSNTADHVLDPNHEYERPMRPTFNCPYCLYGVYSFYDEEGGLYVTNYDEFKKIIPWKNQQKYHCAIFSWEWFHKIDQWISWRELHLRDKIRVLKGEKSIFAKKEK